MADSVEVKADIIHIKLPDGSVKEVPKGTTALDIARSISPRLADAALAAKIQRQRCIDLTTAARSRHRAPHPHRPRSRGAAGLTGTRRRT